MSRVTARTGGSVAGLPFLQLDQLVMFNPELTLKLFSWLGKHAMSLVGTRGKRSSVGSSKHASAPAEEQAAEDTAGSSSIEGSFRDGSSSMKRSGMESFWLMKMKAQESKVQEASKLQEVSEALKEKEEEAELATAQAQRSISSYKVLYAGQQRKVEEMAAAKAKLEEELNDIKEKQVEKLKRQIDDAKKRESDGVEYQSKLLKLLKTLSEKV
jgi:hypothetical protein